MKSLHWCISFGGYFAASSLEKGIRSVAQGFIDFFLFGAGVACSVIVILRNFVPFLLDKFTPFFAAIDDLTLSD